MLYIASESSFACRTNITRPFNGLPYYEVQSVKFSYDDAEATCRRMEADLLTIRHNTLIVTEPARKWLSAKKRPWTHVTLDLALTYDSDLSHQSEDCTAIMLEDEQLKAALCSDKSSALCINQDLGYCKGSIYKYRCYFTPDAYKESQQTFSESTVICQKENASLVAIIDLPQIKWLSQTFVGSFWTGYKYNASSTDYYWHDGSRVINANWKMDQNMTGDCVVMTENGEWEMSDCMEKEAFICSLEVSYARIRTTCQEFDDECICLWKGDGRKTFNEAMEQCLSDGGTMFYKNSENKAKSLLFTPSMWIGISDGHTKGVFRGVDTTVKHYNLAMVSLLSGCLTSLETESCTKSMDFFCQNKIDELLYPCDKSSGCLRVTDHWDIEDPQLAYQGTPDIVIQNVESLEICWDLCVTYIGFECLVVAYDIEDKSCGLSATVSEDWGSTKLVISRRRTRHVIDPESYCMVKVADDVTMENAKALCANYKSGWDIPVIRDHVMLEELGNLTSRESKSWISATIDTKKVLAFTTFDGEYLKYSRWLESQPVYMESACVVVDDNNYWRTESCSKNHIAICFLNLTASCNNVPDINNGNHVHDPTTGIVNYTCNVGYYMATSNVTYVLFTCDCNDNMDLTNVENCTAIPCPEPPTLEGSTIITEYNNTKLGAIVIYQCNDNFKVYSDVQLSNSTKIFKKTCELDSGMLIGKWSGNYTCLEITCSEPVMIPHAIVFKHGNKLHDNITYICNTNYKINGTWTNTRNATCVQDENLDGIWLNVPKCEEITCPEPFEVDNATKVIHGTRIGDNVTYTCTANYRIQGTSTNETNATCEYNEKFEGVWTKVPMCEAITCEIQPEVNNSKILAAQNTSNIGAIVTYQCDDGFMVEQSGAQLKYTKIFNMTCEIDYTTLTGKWNGNCTCVVSPICPVPPEVLYSKVTVTGFYPGDMAFFTCNPGYIIVTEPVSKQMTNMGQSTCILDPKNQTLAIWDNTPKCEVIPYGECLRQCPPPENVDGATVTYKNTFVSSQGTYTADIGYKFENNGTSRTSICQIRRGWSSKSPKLKCKTCTKLRVSGSTLSTEMNDVGTEVEIQCINPKAKMEIGLSVIHVRCEQSQRWSHTPKSCKVNRCGPVEYVEHGSLANMNNTVGGYAVILCNPSYRFEDGTQIKRVHCLQTLTWEPAGQCLYNTCPRLRKPLFGTVSTNLALENTVVDIKCLPGYMFLDGNITKQITCNSSFKWSGKVEDCQVIKCPEPPEIPHAKMTSRDTLYNSTIMYKCDGIYCMQNGFSELTIQCGENGKWNQTSFSCELGRCPPLPKVKNAALDTSLAVNGTMATYTCHEGYIFSSNSPNMTLLCNGEDWNITETTCSAVKCPVLNLTHADWSDSGNNFGDIVAFTCNEGYQYSNSKGGILKCQANAEWSGDSNVCRPISCGTPPDVGHAIRNVSMGNSLGAIVTYKCRNKYWFRRGQIQTSIMCDKTGLWSYVPSKCIPITCPAVPTWPDKVANTTERHVGAVINVTSTKQADEGTTLLISRCMPHGKWEPSLDENLASFTPPTVEAEYSKGIGITVAAIMLSVIAVIVLSDLRKIMNDVKGIKQKRRR